MAQPINHTKLDWINAVQQSTPIYLTCWIPGINLHWSDFADLIQKYQDKTLQYFIKHVTYTEKRELFTKLGFSVEFMTLSALKAMRHGEDNFEQDFLDGKSNVFFFFFSDSNDNFIMILRYDDPQDPLVNHTVSPEERQHQDERASFAKSFLAKIRANRK